MSDMSDKINRKCSCDIENDEGLQALKEYLGSECVCSFLVHFGNCENCLNYGDSCKCDIEYLFDSEEIKKTFTCPIGWSVFIDPVIASDGHTYERKKIEDWFMNSDKSPMTGLVVCSKELYPNYAIKSLLKNCKKIYK